MSLSNFQKFTAALADPFVDLENSWHQMLAMRDVNTSEGVHLSQLGKLVGKPRTVISDDELYRRKVRAQVAVNKSNGRIDELLAIAELVVFDDDAEYVLDNQGNAAYVIRIEGIVLDWAVAMLLIEFLRKATVGGVRVIVEWWTQLEAEVFRFAPFTGVSASKGFGDTTNAAIGGHLASAAR